MTIGYLEIFDRPQGMPPSVDGSLYPSITSTRCQEAIGQIVADADERPLRVLRGTSQTIPLALPRFSGLSWAERMFFFLGAARKESAAIPVISTYLAVMLVVFCTLITVCL